MMLSEFLNYDRLYLFKEVAEEYYCANKMIQEDDMKRNLIHAAEYLRHVYALPEKPSRLPLADEGYLDCWKEAGSKDAFLFFKENFQIASERFRWERQGDICLSVTATLAGHIPVIRTKSHMDFCNLVGIFDGRGTAMPYPETVNACMMQAKQKNVFHHRILLMNDAPYSSIAADKIDVPAGAWLEQSSKLRLRHECAHYESLRLFDGMRNHALDEIMADAMGQIAAFGEFSAERQRIFFGLQRETGCCDGRLTFYTRNVFPDERHIIYEVVDKRLDALELEIRQALSDGMSEYELLSHLLTCPLRT